MPTKVLHLRLTARAIYLSRELLRNAIPHVDALGLSDVVSRTLYGMLEGMIAKGLVQDISEEDAFTALQASKINVIPLPAEEPIFKTAKAKDVNKLGDSLTAEIERVLSRVASGGLTPAAPEKLPEDEAETAGETMSFEVLRGFAPKDRFIEAAEENETLRTAVELVYPKLPREDWGTEMAEKLLARTIQLLQSGAVARGGTKGRK